MKIHPVAELFPMFPEDELRELANDIKANGLQQPIVKMDDTLLDGRNRLAACELVGIKPETKEYTGKDATAFIISINLKRRHLTREQRDDVIRGLREQGMTLTKIAKAVGVSEPTARRVSQSSNNESEIINERGQSRPSHYTSHEEELSRPHVANNSGDNEWYTPKSYAEAARSVMGKIELDPASTPEANKIIKAERIYAQKDDGLKQEWGGRLWMNPPYASDLVGKFIDKLVKSVELKQVTEALVLINNATETKWFARLVTVSSFLCFPTGRVKFWHPNKDSATPLQGQCVAYIGKNGKKFYSEFKQFGLICEVCHD